MTHEWLTRRGCWSPSLAALQPPPPCRMGSRNSRGCLTASKPELTLKKEAHTLLGTTGNDVACGRTQEGARRCGKPPSPFVPALRAAGTLCQGIGNCTTTNADHHRDMGKPYARHLPRGSAMGTTHPCALPFDTPHRIGAAFSPPISLTPRPSSLTPPPTAASQSPTPYPSPTLLPPHSAPVTLSCISPSSAPSQAPGRSAPSKGLRPTCHLWQADRPSLWVCLGVYSTSRHTQFLAISPLLSQSNGQTETMRLHKEGDIRTARTALCTARAPRVRFYQPFPAFFTCFQGGKDAVA